MLSRTMVFAVLFCALQAQAPDPGFDASIPDASVGTGGAETSQEMEDGKMNTVCAQSQDCERGFTCSSSRCKYVGFRPATQPGCVGGTAVLLLPVMLVLRRRRRA